MGLLAMPAMLRAGYNTKIAAGAITAGGCLGILIPPSVLLIVYGATAGVSVVKLYAGAFFPGIMLAGLYVGYVIIVALITPEWMPALPEKERYVELPPFAQSLSVRGKNALLGLARALAGAPGVASRTVLGQSVVSRPVRYGQRIGRQPHARDRKSTRLNSSHITRARMPSSA